MSALREHRRAGALHEPLVPLLPPLSAETEGDGVLTVDVVQFRECLAQTYRGGRHVTSTVETAGRTVRVRSASLSGESTECKRRIVSLVPGQGALIGRSLEGRG